MLIGLGISGGIAAYKTCEIVRGLDKALASARARLDTWVLRLMAAKNGNRVAGIRRVL